MPVNLTIDGRPIRAAEGQSVLAAALDNGIHIPHFCWHPGLKVSGNCRMCLVEIRPQPKLQIACNTPVREGMEVVTKSDKVAAARRGVLEFLLLNHPLDCPVCDQAGECPLQDQTYAYGAATSRFDGEKRKPVSYDMGRMITFVPTRCIHCTRCVRFLRDVAGSHEMGRLWRGHHLEVSSFDRPLESPFSGNIADICPVGCLTLKPARFRGRAWDLDPVESVCPGCSIGCNIFVDIRDRRIDRLVHERLTPVDPVRSEREIVRFRPRYNPDVNQWWMCDAGRLLFDAHVNPRRAVKALADGRPQPLDEARAAAGERFHSLISTHGGRALAVLASPRLTNEELYASLLLCRGVGGGLPAFVPGINRRPIEPVGTAPLTRTLISDDKQPNSTGGRLIGLEAHDSLSAWAERIVPEIEAGKIRGLLVLGEDPLGKADEGIRQRLSAAFGRLDLLLAVDLFETDTARAASLFLPGRSYAETSGSFTNHRGLVQRIVPGLRLRGTTGLLRLLASLSRAAGGAEFPDLAAEMLVRLQHDLPAFANVTEERRHGSGPERAGG